MCMNSQLQEEFLATQSRVLGLTTANWMTVIPENATVWEQAEDVGMWAVFVTHGEACSTLASSSDSGLAPALEADLEPFHKLRRVQRTTPPSSSLMGTMDYTLSSNPPPPNLKSAFRLGDWLCHCAAHNFGRNTSCIACGSPRSATASNYHHLQMPHPTSDNTGSPNGIPFPRPIPSPRFNTSNGSSHTTSPVTFYSTGSGPATAAASTFHQLPIIGIPSASSHSQFAGTSPSSSSSSPSSSNIHPRPPSFSHPSATTLTPNSSNLPTHSSKQQAQQSHAHPLLTPSGRAFAVGGKVQNISTDPLAPCIMYWPDNEPFPEQAQIRPGGLTGIAPPILNTGNRGPISHQPGDWICQKCNYLNWRRRKVCQTCFPYAEGNGDSISSAVQAERIALLTSVLSQTQAQQLNATSGIELGQQNLSGLNQSSNSGLNLNLSNLSPSQLNALNHQLGLSSGFHDQQQPRLHPSTSLNLPTSNSSTSTHTPLTLTPRSHSLTPPHQGRARPFIDLSHGLGSSIHAPSPVHHQHQVQLQQHLSVPGGGQGQEQNGLHQRLVHKSQSHFALGQQYHQPQQFSSSPSSSLFHRERDVQSQREAIIQGLGMRQRERERQILRQQQAQVQMQSDRLGLLRERGRALVGLSRDTQPSPLPLYPSAPSPIYQTSGHQSQGHGQAQTQHYPHADLEREWEHHFEREREQQQQLIMQREPSPLYATGPGGPELGHHHRPDAEHRAAAVGAELDGLERELGGMSLNLGGGDQAQAQLNAQLNSLNNTPQNQDQGSIPSSLFNGHTHKQNPTPPNSNPNLTPSFLPMPVRAPAPLLPSFLMQDIVQSPALSPTSTTTSSADLSSVEEYEYDEYSNGLGTATQGQGQGSSHVGVIGSQQSQSNVQVQRGGQGQAGGMYPVPLPRARGDSGSSEMSMANMGMGIGVGSPMIANIWRLDGEESKNLNSVSVGVVQNGAKIRL